MSGGFPRLTTAAVLLGAALVLALATWTGALSFVGKGIGGLTSWLLDFGGRSPAAAPHRVVRRDRTWLIQKKVVGKPPVDVPVVREAAPSPLGGRS